MMSIIIIKINPQISLGNSIKASSSALFRPKKDECFVLLIIVHQDVLLRGLLSVCEVHSLFI